MNPVIRNTLSALANDIKTDNLDNNGQLRLKTGKTGILVHKTHENIE